MSSTRADLAAVVVQSNDSSAAAPNLDENLICFSSLFLIGAVGAVFWVQEDGGLLGPKSVSERPVSDGSRQDRRFVVAAPFIEMVG